jgi:hypothetical protein
MSLGLPLAVLCRRRSVRASLATPCATRENTRQLTSPYSFSPRARPKQWTPPLSASKSRTWAAAWTRNFRRAAADKPGTRGLRRTEYDYNLRIRSGYTAWIHSVDAQQQVLRSEAAIWSFLTLPAMHAYIASADLLMRVSLRRSLCRGRMTPRVVTCQGLAVTHSRGSI